MVENSLAAIFPFQTPYPTSLLQVCHFPFSPSDPFISSGLYGLLEMATNERTSNANKQPKHYSKTNFQIFFSFIFLEHKILDQLPKEEIFSHISNVKYTYTDQQGVGFKGPSNK